MNVANMKRKPSAIQNNDFGGLPYVTDLNSAALRNGNFRTAIWTGENLQMTLMSLQPGGEVGLEVHRNVDQFLYILSGNVIVMMGGSRGNLTFRQSAAGGYGIFVPAGVWHNIVNAGNYTVKLYTVYAPPEHERGTVEVLPPTSPAPVIPAVPTYPARPVRPPASSVPATPSLPLYPAQPVRPPASSVPATPTFPSMPMDPGSWIPLAQEVDAQDNEYTQI